LKWEGDVDGDGKSEVFLALKSDLDQQSDTEHPPTGWTVYIADRSGTGYMKSTGTEEKVNSLSVDDLPVIDLGACFVGQVSEIGKRGLVTIQYATPRSGAATATIYAFAVSGDHLTRSQLAEYDPDKGPNLVFTKYLSDNKRTLIQVQELTP
jgi:hypothetical protein